MGENTDCSAGSCACKDKKQGGQNVKVTTLANTFFNCDITNSDDNDIWESDDNNCADGYEDSDNPAVNKGDVHTHELSRDIAALKRRHENRGYLDGLTKGNEAGLQLGFDRGYPIGAQLGGLVGELVAETIWKSSLGLVSGEKKEEAMRELRISNILDSQYFDDALNISDPQNHPIIHKWSTFYRLLDQQI